MKWIKKVRIQWFLSSIEKKLQFSILVISDKIIKSTDHDSDYDYDKRMHDIEDLNEELDKCFTLAEKAIGLNPYYGEPYAVRAELFVLRGLTNKNGKSLRMAINDLQSALSIGPLVEANRSKWNDQIKLHQIRYENWLHYGRFE